MSLRERLALVQCPVASCLHTRPDCRFQASFALQHARTPAKSHSLPTLNQPSSETNPPLGQGLGQDEFSIFSPKPQPFVMESKGPLQPSLSQCSEVPRRHSSDRAAPYKMLHFQATNSNDLLQETPASPFCSMLCFHLRRTGG